MKGRANDSGGGRPPNKLFEDDFFIPFDGQIFDDIKDCRLTPTEFCVYSMLLRQVNFHTGIWTGSAYWIYVGWGGQLNRRTIQQCLSQLQKKGLINSFHRRGQRNDYAVAIHDYRIRFGSWRGCKLDASATTDPKNPVYQRDSAATAKSQRDDRESTANSLRSNTELSANPIAGNTPEQPECPDGQDVQDEHRKSITSPSTLQASRGGSTDPDVDAAADALSPDSVEVTEAGRSGSEAPPLDRARFMGALRSTWKRLRDDDPFGVTDTQITNAMAAAGKLGEDVFLATWNYWLQSCGGDLAFPSEQGPDVFVVRSWPLEYFMSSGGLHAFAEEVRPVAGIAEDEVLCFLVDAQKKTSKPVSVTDENLAILRRCLDECFSVDDLVSPYDGRPMDAFVTQIVVPLEAKRRAEREECKRRREDRDKNRNEALSGSPRSAAFPC